jgi:hypothetical protein
MNDSLFQTMRKMYNSISYQIINSFFLISNQEIQ